jgi:hypothetical protein
MKAPLRRYTLASVFVQPLEKTHDLGARQNSWADLSHGALVTE